MLSGRTVYVIGSLQLMRDTRAASPRRNTPGASLANGPTFSGRAGARPSCDLRGPRRPPGPLQRLVISPLVRARRCSPLGRKPQAQDRAGSAPPVMVPLRFRDARVEGTTSTAA